MGCETRVRGLTHAWSRVKAMTVATLAVLGVTWIPVTSLEPEGLFYRTLCTWEKKVRIHFLTWKRGSSAPGSQDCRAPQLPVETDG